MGEAGEETVDNVVRIDLRRKISDVKRIEENQHDDKPICAWRAREQQPAKEGESDTPKRADAGDQRIEKQSLEIGTVPDEEGVRRSDDDRNKKDYPGLAKSRSRGIVKFPETM